MAAKKVWTDGTILLEGVELSAEANRFSFPLSQETLNATNLASGGWREVEAGGKSGTVELAGFVNDASADPHAVLRDTPAPYIAAIESRPAVIGDYAVFLQAQKTQLAFPHRVQQLAEFALSADSKGALAHGNVLGNHQNITATGNGTGYQAGAVASGATARAMLIVTAFTGTSIDVIVESDATDAWVGAETTRFTFTQVTAAPAVQIVTLAGPVTDTWWRTGYTCVSVTDADFFVLLATS